MTVPHTITVTAERTYHVHIGRGLLDELLPALAGASRVAIIHAPTLEISADAVREHLLDMGLTAICIQVPDAEDAKTAEVAAYCWQVLGESGFTRNDAVVSLGGGATTDLAGFVAATWLRGIAVVHLPTTLLAMVDAAVGGKTGINTASGKNLVGAFYSPSAVLCDLNTLDTLPANDLIAGLAEVVKVGLTSDTSILTDIIAAPELVKDPGSSLLQSLVERAVRVKADVVSDDFTETASSTGRLGREVLNYGHTFGHAVERAERYRWRHGAAISVGMMYVAELSNLAGHLSDTGVDLHRQVLTSLGLPTTYPGGRWDQLMSAMAVDKKARGSMLRFVILDEPGRPRSLDGPDPALLVAAYGAISS